MSSTSNEKITIVVGTVGSGEPYSMISSDSKWTGMEFEMWAEVEKRTNYKVEMKQVGDHASIFGELATGRIDFAANYYIINAKKT